MWTRLYRKGTSTQKGTLLQLKQLINRTNVPREPQKDINATEDFIEVVFVAHTVAAALKYFGMASTSDKPNSEFLLDTSEAFIGHVHHILDTYVDFTLPTSANEARGSSGDGVYDCAVQVLTFCLFHAEFVDSVREGDGDRVIRCWRFFLPLFECASRVNYSKEAIILLSQLMSLSPRQAHQIKWYRFVNVHGWPGHNISCDLHMEHLNRVCKMAVRSLGANLTSKALVRVAKCLGPIMKATQQFDAQTNVYRPYGTHSRASNQKDIDQLIHELVDFTKVFEFTPN